MRRGLEIAGLLWLSLAVGLGDQDKAAKALAARSAPNAVKGGGTPRKALGPRLTNPNSPAARLFQASPEERENPTRHAVHGSK